MVDRLGFSDALAARIDIMPRLDVNQALKLAFTMDILFWQPLPRVSFYKDMYIQAMGNFPSIRVDETQGRIFINTDEFFAKIHEYLEREDDWDNFRLFGRYSMFTNRSSWTSRLTGQRERRP
ncbi:MAG: hypothetical protein LBQ00_05600 [Syntrophobacterales bacterium]|jgi:hypothetical protein|nr:hypothetical protein [Syntrophobacterales bacterium]